MKRIIIVVAVLAAGVAAIVLWRTGDDRAAPAPTGGGGTASTGTGTAAPALSRGPVIPPRPAIVRDGGGAAAEPASAGGPPPGPSLSFDDETRDDGWAPEQERELTLRLERLVADLAERGARIDVDGIECRRTLCRVKLAAPDVDALGKLYGALETPAGLYGWADNVLLMGVETTAEGRIKTAVVAMFERD